MGFLWALIVGGLIGWVASLIIGKDVPGGIIGNIVAGFVGAMIGQAIFGTMGPVVGGFRNYSSYLRCNHLNLHRFVDSSFSTS